MTQHTRSRADWLSIPEALDRILAAVSPLDAETVQLADALGRTLAEAVTSPIDQPLWDNSAMDGYAVRAEDVRGATEAAPVTLIVVDDVPAGRFPARPIAPGQATRIMTGAPIPAGADSVIRVEHTVGAPDGAPGSGWGAGSGSSGELPGTGEGKGEREAQEGGAQAVGDAGGSGAGGMEAVGGGRTGAGWAESAQRTEATPTAGAGAGKPSPSRPDTGGVADESSEPQPQPQRIRILNDADALRNIRRRGEDLRAGTVVLEGGQLLRPGEIGVLAAVGKGEVAVQRQPRVAILSNGDELVDLDRFDEVLAGRRIVNSNGYALCAAVRAAGCEPVSLGIAGDDRQSLRAHLEAARGADALITTAGASVGEHDLIKDVLAEIGFTLDFWRVRMRPGSPFSFGRLGSLPVFGLPGNPVSALVTFEVLVRPALRRLLGRGAVHSRTVRVRAAERIPGAGRLTHFPRATLEPDDDGGWRARLTGPQGSGILTSMAAADVLLVVPEGVAEIAPGEPVTALPVGEPAVSQPVFPVPGV